MPSIFTTDLLLGLVAAGALAASPPVKLCTSDACDWCPNSLTTSGTGYPACVIYDRDTVLGGKEADYGAEKAGKRMIYYDIAEVDNPECKTIIRTPANTNDKNCGMPIYGGSGGICFEGSTDKTFMVQFCCGTGDCTGAGVGKRDGLGGSSSFSSVVLRDTEGSVVVPHSVGDHEGDKYGVFLEDHGINSTSMVQKRSVGGTPVYQIGYDPAVVSKIEPEPVPAPTKRAAEPALEKRKCKDFKQDGAQYTKTGSESFKVSGLICDSNSKVTITNENSISQTTTFGASVGDPFGIVTASVEFSVEETASQSYSYEFTPKENQCGHVAFTPFFNCVGGTITGCEGGDQTGEVCTAKRIDKNQIDGGYLFVQTN